jgi:hypothetical protein
LHPLFNTENLFGVRVRQRPKVTGIADCSAVEPTATPNSYERIINVGLILIKASPESQEVFLSDLWITVPNARSMPAIEELTRTFSARQRTRFTRFHGC